MPASGSTGTDRSQHLVTGAACVFVALLGLLRVSGIGGIGGGPPELGDELSIFDGSATAMGADSGPREAWPSARKQQATGMTLVVPRIGLSAPVVELGVGKHERLELPRRFDRVGWWSGGPRPGAVGPAVVVGHVDSTEGPAVFQRLHELLPGDVVMVRHPKGPATRFVVTHSEKVKKSRFPTSQVYGKVPEPELRLITCPGHFDRTARRDTDNLIVYAALDPMAAAGEHAQLSP